MTYRLLQARHGKMLYNPKDAYVGRSFDLYREFSESETSFFIGMLTKRSIVVEVGANIGAHTVPIAQHCDSVLAFEPQRLAYQLLCANLALNEIQNVIALPMAVGAERGVIKVPVLNPDVPQNHGGLELGNRDDGEPVEVRTLDSFNLGNVALLKVDVEGMELDVLKGAEQTIKRLRPAMYLENDRKDKSAALIAKVFELGYEAWWHLAPLYNPANAARNRENVFPGIVSVNMLCFPKEFHAAVTDMPKITDVNAKPPGMRM